MKPSFKFTYWALVFLLTLGLHTSNVLARNQQPSKQEALAASAATGQVLSASQPGKTEAMAAASSGGARTQPAKAEALAAASGDMPSPTSAAVSACSLCQTCGGNWPVFSGAIPARTGAKPYERGLSCSGSPVSTLDSLPYLCCEAAP